MSSNIRRRTAAWLVAASVGLLGAGEAQAAPKASVANQIQGFVRILWQQAGEALGALMSAPASHHREGHNPPGLQRCGSETANGPGIDPDGLFNGNNRNGNNGHGNC